MTESTCADLPSVLPELWITHNHGHLHLKDVVLEHYSYDSKYSGHCEGYNARGTVISGSTTSRLWSATSTKYDTPGEVQMYPLYGRVPRLTSTPGRYRVDCTFCG